MLGEFDTSAAALLNRATGNPHFDCWKFGSEDVLFLCYLARDRDPDSAEAALDRLRSLLSHKGIELYLPQIFQTAVLVSLGSDQILVRGAAKELLDEMEKRCTGKLNQEKSRFRSSGQADLDRLLEPVINDLAPIFGERLLSAYVVGSKLDGSQVQSSDLDLHLLLRGAYSAYLKQAVLALSEELSRKYKLDLDLVPFFEADITPWADVRTKLGGVHIFGDYPTETLRLPPLPDYVRENMHRAYYYMARCRRFPNRLCYPAGAPDAADFFSGYNSRIHEDGSPSTKELVVVAGWISTALATRAGNCYVASKSASYSSYREHVNDEWTAHLQDVFELVRQQWNYRLPTSDEDKVRLAAICLRQVAFENHFLLEYQKFLQEESTSEISHHAERAKKLLSELFPQAGSSPCPTACMLLPAWQISTRRRDLDPRLTSVDHFLVKVQNLRNLGDKALREAFQRWEEFGVIVFACKETYNPKYDLLGLQEHFGQVMFHPRSDETGVTAVRNLFKPDQAFVGTGNALQTPHTDGSFLPRPPGIVALQTEICGLCGGESTLVFGDMLYRHLESRHPKDLEKLFQEGAYTIGRGNDRHTRPAFWKEDGRIHMAFRCGNGESLEIAKWALLGFNKIYRYVNDAANQLRFRLPTNHVLVVDNHRNLHGRLGWPADTVRCLNRLWLDGTSSNPLYPGLGIRQ
ncbi:MAG: TauD/TfdA family dioxygenase [Candidatus Obscuribacterales bacterium]|nr:TauD/TfdA family dioxygenase [Candidatus Obscuribacterales bacterium]